MGDQWKLETVYDWIEKEDKDMLSAKIIIKEVD